MTSLGVPIYLSRTLVGVGMFVARASHLQSRWRRYAVEGLRQPLGDGSGHRPGTPRSPTRCITSASRAEGIRGTQRYSAAQRFRRSTPDQHILLALTRRRSGFDSLSAHRKRHRPVGWATCRAQVPSRGVDRSPHGRAPSFRAGWRRVPGEGGYGAEGGFIAGSELTDDCAAFTDLFGTEPTSSTPAYSQGLGLRSERSGREHCRPSTSVHRARLRAPSKDDLGAMSCLWLERFRLEGEWR